MLTQLELSKLESKGLIKIPLIVAILTEAKAQGLKWIFQCEGENFYPWTEANLETGNYDAWTYTNDIEASLKEYETKTLGDFLNKIIKASALKSLKNGMISQEVFDSKYKDL